MDYYHAPYDLLFVLPLLLMIGYAVIRERRRSKANRKGDFNPTDYPRDRDGKYRRNDFRDWTVDCESSRKD